MQEAVRLVEINGFGDVSGDQSVILMAFLDAIDLNCKEHWDAAFLQLSRERDGLRRAPAVTIENDARVAFFAVGERAIVIGVEQANNFGVGALRVMVSDRFRVDTIRIHGAKLRGQLDFAVDHIVAVNVAADEADDDDRRGNRIRCSRRAGQK